CRLYFAGLWLLGFRDFLRRPRRLAAEEAPGRVAGLVRENREARGVAGKEIVAAHAEAAAVPATALGVLDQLVAHDAHRVARLRLLDRRVLRVLEVRLHGVHAIGRQCRAVATRDRLVVGEVLAAGRVHAAEGDVADAALGPRDHSI